VKFDGETLPTVPDVPPAAGPDRALGAEPAVPGPPVAPPPGVRCPAVVEDGVEVAEEDSANPTETPITEHVSAAATIQRLLLLDNSRRAVDRCAGVATLAEPDRCGEDGGGDGGAATPALGLSASDGPDVALGATGGRVSWESVGS
jgi:hypothetical protein